MLSLERAAASSRATWLSLVGLVLVPLLVAGGILWATWDSDTRLDRVQAAVVNLDEPVKVNGQLVPLGRQLAGGLVSGGDEPADSNFSWVLTDADDAAGGLASGAYAAVVTVPEDFSARATSFSKTDPDEIEPAEITVQTSQIRGIADTVVGESIAAAATAALNSSLTEQYLDNIYVGFNSTQKQFAKVADAAGDLSDGTSRLADGIGKSATGADRLADGLGQLDDGASQLSTGATKLSNGVEQLSTGLGQLADGTRALPAQVRKLAGGARKVADGTDELADGLGKLDRATPRLTKGTAANAAGAKEFAASGRKFSDGLEQYTLGVRGVAQGLQQYRQGLRSGAEQLPPCPETDQVCQAYAQAFAGAVQGLGDPDDPKSLVGGAAALSARSDDIAAGGEGIADGLAKSSAGAVKLDQGVRGLAGGIDQLADGADQLADGSDKIADGTGQLADGVKPLAKGIAGSASGAEQLSTGASQLAEGTAGLADGTNQSATGARKLSDGLTKLSDGGAKLADGTEQLADGLATGAKQVPTYDKDTRTKLAEVVATPVDNERPDSLFADIANTTFLAVIALWLGGLASFLVLRAVPARVLTSMKPSWRLAAESMAPGWAVAVIQALALTAVLRVLLGLDAGQVLGLLGLLTLAGLAFAALNQALVAWFGGIGRFVSVAAVVLATAGAITSAVPAALDAITPFLPLTPALEGARAIVSNGSGAGGAVSLLVAWLLVGVAATVVAVARRRMLPAAAVVPAT